MEEAIKQIKDNADKTTAMQEMFNSLKQNGISIPNHVKKRMLELEKEQIKNAFKRGLINEMNGIKMITSDDYYKSITI